MRRSSIRNKLFLFMALLLFGYPAQSDVTGGIDWLNTASQADGSIASVIGPATPFQSTAESLLAFEAAGQAAQPVSAAAEQFILGEAYNNTENLSRKIAVGRSYNTDVSGFITELLASQNVDGGYGELLGFESSVLDTAFALQALDAGSAPASAALNALLLMQNADGGFSLTPGDNSSGYVSAVALRALQKNQLIFDLSQSIQQAANFLVACRLPTGGWGSDWETAVVLRALIPSKPNDTEWRDAANQLRDAQQANGSWSNDAYATALAIQAMILADDVLVVVVPDTGSLVGRAVNSANGLPIVGASVTVNGITSEDYDSDLNGLFQVTAIDPGDANVEVSAAGFQTATFVQNIVADQASFAGDVDLTPLADTGFIYGRITDATTGEGVPGAVLEFDTGVIQSVFVNSSGDFSIATSPTAFTINVIAPGYRTATATGAVAAGEYLNFGVQLELDNTGPGTITNVSGMVVDQVTRLPISGATVTVVGDNVDFTSDVDGRFTAEVSSAGVTSLAFGAGGYLPINVDVLTSTGSTTDIGSVFLTRVQPVTTSTVSGVVRDVESFAPIANAEIRLDAANVIVRTASDGSYTISGIPSLSFDVQAQAVGYLPGSQTVSLAVPLFQVVDFLLSRSGSDDLQVVSVSFASGNNVVSALQRNPIDIVLGNNSIAAIETQLFASLIDVNGLTVNRIFIAPAGLVGGLFFEVPAQDSLALQYEWESQRFTPGNYSLVIQAFDPDSGRLLSERSVGLTIAETRQVTGQVKFDPPIAQLGTNQPVRITADLVSQGNVAIAGGDITATVTLRNGGDERARDLLSTRVFVEQPNLSSPQGMDLDSQGKLYVADSGLDMIVQITPVGATSIVADQLTNPVDVDVDAAGMHIAQSNRYVFVGFDGTRREEPLSFSPVAVEALANGSVMLSAGNALYELVGGVGPAVLRIDQGLAAPTGLAIRPDGSVVIADGTNGIWELSNGVFRRLRSDLGRVSNVAVAGDGTIYFTDVTLGTLRRIESDDSVTNVASGLTGLVGLQIAANGNIIVGNSISDEILEITPAGVQSVLAFSPIFSPSAGAADAAGRTLFAGDNQILYALDSGGTFTEIANLGFQPTAIDIGPGGTTAIVGGNQLAVLDAAGLPVQETTLTFSADGIAADSEVVLANSAGGLVSVDGSGNETDYLPELGTPRNAIPAPGGAAYVLTDNGFLIRQEADASYSIIEQGLVNPTGLTVDASGDIYITETSTRRIRRISPTGGITEVLTTTFTPSGIAVLNPDEFLVSVLNDRTIFRVDPAGETLIATLSLPIDNEILIASDGAAWVTHPNQTRVSRLDLATSNVIVIFGSSGGGGGGLSAGPVGDVFLAQRGRIQRFLPDGTSEPPIFVTDLPFGSSGSRTTGLVPRAAGGWWFYQNNDFIYEIDSSNTVVEDYIATVVADDVEFLPNGDLAIATPLGIGAVTGPLELPRRMASEAVDRLAAESATSLIATSVSTVRRIDLAVATTTVLQSGFQQLRFVDIAPGGNIVMGDEAESRLLTLDPAGNIIDDVFGIDRPSAITIAPDGTVLVATDGATSQILSLTPSGLPTRFSTLRSVDAMVRNADGSMIASDNFSLHNIDANGQVTQTIQEFGVTGLAADMSGNVFGTNSFDSTLILVNNDLSFEVRASGVGNIVDIESQAGVGDLQFIDSTAGSLGRVVGGDGLSVTAAGLIAVSALAVNDDGTRTVLNFAGSLFEVDSNDELTKLPTRGQFPRNTRGLARKSKETFFVSQPIGSPSQPGGSTVYQTTVEAAGESAGNVGEVAFTATVPFGQLPLSGESMLVDFGDFTPQVSGDYIATAVVTSGGASGELSNQLHVGPGAQADLAVLNDQVGLGNVAESAVLSLSGGGSSSVFQIDLDAPMLTFQSPVFVIGSLTSDSVGNIYVTRENFSGTNSGEIHKISPDGTSQLIASGLNHGGDMTIDNNDTLYFGADFFGDVFTSTTDGVISTIANVSAGTLTGSVKGIDFAPDGSLGVVARFNTASRVSLDGSSVEVIGSTKGSFNQSLAIDGDGNYYTYTTKIGEVAQIERDFSQFERFNLSRIAPNGDVSTIMANTGLSGSSFNFTANNLSSDCSGNILLAPRILDGVISPDIDEIYQLDSRTGAVRTVLSGLSIDPRMAQLRALRYDRLGERLLIESSNDVPGLPSVDIWTVRAGCGGVQADIHVISRNDVDLSNADPAPNQTVDRPDGTREFIWNISSATESEVQIDLSLLFQDLVEGEQRPIFSEAFIEFSNTFVPGEEVQVPIDIPSVFAAGRVTVDLATNGTVFGPSEDVSFSALVQNAGNAAFDGSVEFIVEDEAGGTVTSIPGGNISGLASQDSVTATGTWNTGTILTGDYGIRVQITDISLNVVANDEIDVTLISSGAGLPTAAATVLTDKVAYGAWDTVNVTARLQNTTLNAIVPDSVSLLTIVDPSGGTIFSAAGSFGELQPGQLFQYPAGFALSDAQAGQYFVGLSVVDATTSAGVATASTSFNVVRPPSASLRGSVDVEFVEVQAGTPNSCTFTTSNIAATAVDAVKLTYRVVSFDTQAELSSSSETVDLPANGQQVAVIAVDTSGLAEGVYGCLLQASVANDVVDLDGAAFGVASDAISIAANVTTDKTEYLPLEVAVVSTEIRNQSAQDSGSLTVTTTVLASDGSTFSSRVDSVASLGPGAATILISSVPFGQSAPGQYAVNVVVNAEDGTELANSQILITLLSTNDTGVGLAATMSISPVEVFVGDTMNADAVITNNGNAAIVATPLTWRIVDSSTQLLLAEFSSSLQNLAVNASSTDSVQWDADVEPDTIVDVLLLAEFGGVERLIASAQFTVKVVPIDIDASVDFGSRGRLLVLVDPAPSGSTAEEERPFLEALLEAEGWSYTIVNNANDFTAEFQSGMYTSYALLSASVKLANSVQNDVVEAVLDGAGLAVAGDHDNRNSKLEPALGVKANGNLPAATGFSSQASALFTDASFVFMTGINKQKISLQGAVEVATYDGIGNAESAVVTYEFASGKSVYAGFDLLAEAHAAGETSLLRDFLAQVIDFPHPQAVPIKPGVAVPIELTVSNVGDATSGRALIQLSLELVVVDEGVTTLVSPQELIWEFELEADESKSATFWVIVGQASASIFIDVQSGVDPDYVDEESLIFVVDPEF